MPLVCYVSEQNLNAPLDADRLLRLLGVSGKLSGFYYAVYMLEQVQQKPDHVLLITKCLYKQTAQHFETTSGCVERNLEMSRNVQSGNTQNLKSTVIQRSFPKWSVAERRKTAAASDQAAVCACAHSRYFTGGSPSGLRV